MYCPHSYAFKRSGLPLSSGKVSVEWALLYTQNVLQLEEFFQMKSFLFLFSSSQSSIVRFKQGCLCQSILGSSPFILIPFLVFLKLLLIGHLKKPF